VPHLLTVLVLAASASPSPSPSGSGAVVPPDDTVSPGLLGFLSFLFLGVAVLLIGRGLTKQLKRVTFDEDAVNADPVAAGQPAVAGATSTHDEADPTSGVEPASDAERSPS
jgi:hypothetical protein